MAKTTYFEKLKDPRWQKMRLKVLERDGFCCQHCGDDEHTLAVHHRYYEKGKDPWEYPMEALVTLCEECHTEERENRSQEEQKLLFALRRHFFFTDINELACAFYDIKLSSAPERVASAYAWAIRTPEAQKWLIDACDEWHKMRHKRNAAEEN